LAGFQVATYGRFWVTPEAWRGKKAHQYVNSEGRKLDVLAANIKRVTCQFAHLNNLSRIAFGGIQHLLSELIHVELF